MRKYLLYSFILISQVGFSQFTESFEGTGLPAGWTVINQGGPNTWTQINATTSLPAHDGNKFVGIMYDSVAHNDYLVTPQFTVTNGVSNFISFWARSRDPNYPEQMALRLSTTTNTAAAFTTTLIPVIAPPSGMSFHYYTFDLSAFNGQTVYIAFHITTTDMFFMDIDLVQVSAPPACPGVPTNLSASNTTANSVTVSWTASSPPPANGYEYFLSTTNTSPNSSTTPTGSVGAGITTVNLTGLTPVTVYYFWVRNNCSSTAKGIWSSVLTFITDATPSNLPYIYGFENPVQPGWTVINNGNGNSWGFAQDATLAFEGTRFMVYQYDLDFPANTWAFSRGINLVAGQPVGITFRTRCRLAAYPESLKVHIGTARTVASMTTTLWDSGPNGVNYTTYQQHSASFTPTTTGVHHLGFHCYSAADMWLLLVDDINVFSTLSVEDLPFENNITLYPVPVYDFFKLDIKTDKFNTEQMQVSIVDINGRLVKTFEKGTREFYMDNLPAGIYMVQITDGENILVKKVIKQ